MMQCPQCGTENQDDARFCISCGAHLALGSPAASQPRPALSDMGADIPEEVPAWLEKLLVAHGLGPEEEEEGFLGRTAAPPFEAEPKEWSAPVEETPPAQVEGAGEAELTDWLQALRSEGEEREQEAVVEEGAVPAEGEEAFDWLRTLRESDIKAEGDVDLAGVASAGEAGLEEPPDWLRELGEPDEGAGPTLGAEQMLPLSEIPEIEGDEFPGWLRELSGSAEAAEPTLAAEQVPPLVEVPEIEGQEVPEWLRDLGETVDTASVAEQALKVSEEQESEPSALPFVESEAFGESGEEGEPGLPEWLQELRPLQAAPEEELPEEPVAPPGWLTQSTASEVPEVTVEVGELPAPDWLQESMPARSEVSEAEEEKEPALPDWVRDLGPSGSVAAELEGEAVAEAPAGEAVPSFMGKRREEFADPLAPLPASDAPLVASEGEPEEEGEGLAQADIPDWLLALRPQEEGVGLAEAPDIVEFSGPLKGIAGVLPVEPVISLPHFTRPETVPVLAPSASGDLFAEVVAQSALPASAVSKPARPRLVAGAQRTLVYLLLLVAVVIPLLMGPIYGPLDATDLRAGGERFYRVLDGQSVTPLPENALVLIAFDYNPATSAELALQAQAIVDHLRRRDVRIMALSLYPEGAALAWDVLDELEGPDYIYGTDYIHLGYLPNQVAAVRYFLDAGPTGEGQSDYKSGQPVTQSPIAQGISDLSSVDLMIELTGNEGTLRTWVEQVAARTDLPLVAGVSAAIAPYAQPYLDSGQLRALLVGLPGAAEYEAQSGRAGKAINSLGSQVAAQAVIVLLILLGNVIHLVTRGGKE